MKKLISVALITVLTGCAPGQPGSSMFGANAVAGNENFVTIKDPVGLPNESLNAATRHCAQYGKTATFQGKGGDSYECSGTTWCTTYQCK